MSRNNQQYLPVEHTFDFKVKVNYQEGNVAIVGPHNYVPVQPTITYSNHMAPSITSSQCSENYRI